jgi:hypothetical protein
VILGNNGFTVEARAPKVLGVAGMIRISFRAARDKDVYLITQDPHDQTRGYIERLRHQIDNLLPLFQNSVWNPRFRTMALRKQNFIPPGRYFFHKPPCCWVSKKESFIFSHPALLGVNFDANEECLPYSRKARTCTAKNVEEINGTAMTCTGGPIYRFSQWRHIPEFHEESSNPEA